MAVKKLSAPKIIAIVIAVIIVVAGIGSAVYCVTTEQSPAQAFNSVIKSNDEKILGKWQSQSKPGLFAFVFYEDGSYDSYISTVNFSGKYEIKGNKLTLTNPETAKDIIYKFTVNEKVLKLTLIEEDGKKPEEAEENSFDKVDELNQKSFTDLLGELKQSNDTNDTTDSE